MYLLKRYLLTRFLLGSALLLSTPIVNAQADNSKVNKTVTGASPTADQQSNSASDLETTRKIRSALTDDKRLSTYAHNVKIISQNGEVVLKGPVRTAEEKRLVEDAAAKVAGANVKSELEIVPAK